MNTHYDTLEVSSKASQETIRAAYRSLMQRLHPDKHPGNAEIASQAAEVTRAYDVLSDPGQRLIYDRKLAQQAAAESADAAASKPAARASQTKPQSRAAAAAQKNVSPQQQINRRFLGLCVVVIAIIALGWWAKQRSTQIKEETQEYAARPAAARPATKEAETTSAAKPAALAQGVIDIPEYIKELRAPLLHTSHKTGSVLVLDRIDIKVSTPDATATGQLLRDTFIDAQVQIADRLAYLSVQEMQSIEGERLVNKAIAEGIRIALRKPLADPGWVLSTGAGATASLSISTATAASIAESVSIVVSSPRPYLIR
jgi:curved DNA-binding protein CbpA